MTLRTSLAEFDSDIRNYLITNTVFTADNLKLGHLPKDVNGVFIQLQESPEPDTQIPHEYYTIDFWSLDPDGDISKQNLRIISNSLHGEQHFETENFLVEAAFSIGQLFDGDEDYAHRKIYKLTMMFNVRPIDS